jgi:mannose/fructose/N-acetylgalactosamine-specific phosphotransferase system component IID
LRKTRAAYTTEISSMKPTIGQGDVLIIPSITPVLGSKLAHLTLVEGEVQGTLMYFEYR